MSVRRQAPILRHDPLDENGDRLGGVVGIEDDEEISGQDACRGIADTLDPMETGFEVPFKHPGAIEAADSEPDPSLYQIVYGLNHGQTPERSHPD